MAPAAFIRENTRLAAVPVVPTIRLHMAHQATGLWRLAAESGDPDPPPPYWAFPWAGGLALARYLTDHPEAVSGRRVFDLGSGSGLVAIAAAKAGATHVSAADIDPYALGAIPLNAAANDVSIEVVAGDVTRAAPPPADILTVGDLFYERPLARRVSAFLDRCRAAGMTVLVGDPRRRYLPTGRLTKLAEYVVPDVGEVEAAARNPSAVFAWTSIRE
ncbi:MAG TPA: 50S ribosomal protein L11 methyltransferase [Bauldia sp.]|nr:50S ribosomal protein L11 methyltransferase [Bauldia sp.]